jgi:hypothetical protein
MQSCATNAPPPGRHLTGVATRKKNQDSFNAPRRANEIISSSVLRYNTVQGTY